MKNNALNSKHIAILQTKQEAPYVQSLCQYLEQVGATVSLFDLNGDMETVFDAKRHALVLLAGADCISSAAKIALEAYLKVGGKVIFLGGPAFHDTVYYHDGEWLNRGAYFEACTKVQPEYAQAVLDPDVSGWEQSIERLSGFAQSAVTYEKGNYGLASEKSQIHFEVEEFRTYEYFNCPVTPHVKECNGLGFWAKGDDRTQGMFVELLDDNGSRWCTAITSLSEDWQYFLLTPKDFRWWRDSVTPSIDAVDFNHLRKVGFGFAQSHVLMSRGRHGLYMSGIELLHLEQEVLDSMHTVLLDGISPEYQQYPITNAASLAVGNNQCFVQDRNYVLPEALVSCHPGRQATGYRKERTSRFVPLLTVQDEKGLHCGYAAWLDILCSTKGKNGEMEGAVIGCFSAVSYDFYNEDGLSAIVEAAAAMLQPALLLEGGSEEYTYITSDTESITVGVTYAQLAPDASKQVSAEIVLYRDGMPLARYTPTAEDFDENGTATYSYGASYAIAGGQPDNVEVTLLYGGEVIDCVKQSVRFWAAKPLSERKYVYTEDGRFKQDGKTVNFYGINYMPSSGIAEPDNWYFEHYVCRGAYDPDVIRADLARVKDIGFNAISVFLHGFALDSNNMLDMICICEEMGLYVDLGIRSNNHYDAEFIYYSKADADRLIRPLHFHENDTVIAYDINWERVIGSYESKPYLGRKRWDAQWRQWIVDQYGSVEHAEALWGCSAPRIDGEIVGIQDDDMDAPSPEMKGLCAAYYRFMDDVVAKEFNELKLYLRQLDPYHLISFRMCMSGSAKQTPWMKPSKAYYDFLSLASTMDFMAPEGYALSANDESMLQVPFCNAYARYAKPDVPVVWKEYGSHVWCGSNFIQNAEMLEQQGEYYRYILDYCYRSDTSGSYCWYYAGGFRINEFSDFGIINPDGSDRPATKWLRHYAPLMLEPAPACKPEVRLEIERDDEARGIYGMYDRVKQQLREAFDAGKTFSIVDHKGTDEQHLYADEVLNEAVGGTRAEGCFPLRYVNGQIKEARALSDGQLNVTVCNTQKATWREGTVSVVAVEQGAVVAKAVIDRPLAYLEEATVTLPCSGQGNVSLRFALGEVKFGPAFEAKLAE